MKKIKRIIVCEIGGGIHDALRFMRQAKHALLIISLKNIRLQKNDIQLRIDCSKIDIILNYLKKNYSKKVMRILCKLQ